MNGNMITLVSYVGIDLFRGKLVRNFERSLSRNHGSSDGFVREVQLTTSTTYQFMSAVPGWDHVIFILVTNRNVSLGMGLLAVHDAVRRLGEIPKRTAAPAVNPTFQSREEVSEPSIPSVAQPSEPRPPEPHYDRTFEAPQQREPIRETQPVDNGIESRPDRSAASLARASSAPEAGPPDVAAPKVSTREPTAPPAEPATPAARNAPEADSQTAEEPHLETERYYRGVLVDDSETEESSPDPVPIGPRARMFFKRPRDEKRSNRRRRS